MKTNQTASNSLHPPVIAGVSTGGESRGFFDRMKTYSEKLKDPRWQRKRLEVMRRDEFTCQSCQSETSTLNVHHWKYNLNPWDASIDDLETFCEDCHSLIEDQKKDVNQIMRSIKGRGALSSLLGFFQKIEESDLNFFSISSNPETNPVLILIHQRYKDESVSDAAIRIADRINKICKPQKKKMQRSKNTRKGAIYDSDQ